MTYNETDKKTPKFTEEQLKRCDCGARYTCNPQWHYEWCSIYKPEEPKKTWWDTNE